MALPSNIEKQIALEADEYARTYSGTKMIKRPYIAGATEYAIWKVKYDQAKDLLQKAINENEEWGIFPYDLENEIKSFLNESD